MNKVAVDRDVSLKTGGAKMQMSVTTTKVVSPQPPVGQSAATPLSLKVIEQLRGVSGKVGKAFEYALPTVALTALLLGIWQLACSEPGASLPPPSKVISDTLPLILHP